MVWYVTTMNLPNLKFFFIHRLNCSISVALLSLSGSPVFDETVKEPENGKDTLVTKVEFSS